MEAKLTYRRRKAILSRLEDLSYMRDEEQKKVETEMYALAREAVEVGGHGEKWLKKINYAAGRTLAILEATEWVQIGGPGGKYKESGWKVVFTDAMIPY
jgi:hypothetical protein